MKLLIVLSSVLMGCTTYTSRSPERTIFFATTANYGIVTSEQVGNAGSISGTRSSLTNGQRDITALAGETPTLAFADGTVLTGTIDHTAGYREVGNAVKNVFIIKALRDVWLKLIGSSEDTIVEAIRQ